MLFQFSLIGLILVSIDGFRPFSRTSHSSVNSALTTTLKWRSFVVRSAEQSTPELSTPNKQANQYKPDSWDLEMLKALGFDDDAAESSVPILTDEEQLSLREARFYVRSHMAKVIHILVKELQRMYRARFGDKDPPLTWKLVRRAAQATRKDLGKDNIDRSEASRLFLRNTLYKKLDSLEINADEFFAAVDVTSTEWRDCRKRGSQGEMTSVLNSAGQECFIELSSTSELLERLDQIVLPVSLGDGLAKNFASSVNVIRKSVPLLKKEEERALNKLASTHLGELSKSSETDPSRKRYKKVKQYEPFREEGRI